MITELIAIKKALLREHKKYEVPNPEEYREGILTGIEVALSTVDRLIESEDEVMARSYDED
jgi:hypothetical protein